MALPPVIFGQNNVEPYANKDYKDAVKIYKRAYDDALTKYIKNIKRKWQEVELSDQKKWVSYSDDFKKKISIDFLNKEIKISLIVSNNIPAQDLKNAFREQIHKLKSITNDQAYESDPIAKDVDNIIKNKIDHSMLRIRKDIAKKEHKETILLSASKFSEPQIYKKAAIKRNKKVVIASFSFENPSTNDGYSPNTIKKIFAESEKHKLPPALILAIIRHESRFNPMARSDAPAYGLMQIVPESAGLDATKHLYGEPKLLSPGYLYSPSNNIEIGIAYVHILFHNYLENIENNESRIYCTIAAYNTGAGNVARAFTGTTNLSAAMRHINNLNPKETYDRLINKLPYSETRHYLKNVRSSFIRYQNDLRSNLITN